MSYSSWDEAFCTICGSCITNSYKVESLRQKARRKKQEEEARKTREEAAKMSREEALSRHVPLRRKHGRRVIDSSSNESDDEGAEDDSRSGHEGRDESEDDENGHKEVNDEEAQEDTNLSREEESRTNSDDDGTDNENADRNTDDSDSDEEDDGNTGLQTAKYDPDVVSKEGMNWLLNIHCLGVNPQAAGESKAFVSGHGECHGSKIWVDMGNDPNQPGGDGLFFCYYQSSEPDRIVFPFHSCCWEILARAITGSPDANKINMDILYSTFTDLVLDEQSDDSGPIQLDYGDISGQNKWDGYWCWLSVPGEEYSVMDPTLVPGFDAALRRAIADKPTDSPPVNVDPPHLMDHDPLGIIPADILHIILSFIPAKSIMALRVASIAIRNFTSRNDFWKGLIKQEMPWLWEFGGMSSLAADFKSLFFWLDKATRPYRGMTGPLIGLANRRRIWDSCQQIADNYYRTLRGPQEDNEGERLEKIMEWCQCLQVPWVSVPPSAEDSSAITKSLWVHSWSDITDRWANLDAFWNSEGFLIGLGISVNGGQRALGRAYEDASMEGITQESVRILSSDWIKGLILHIPHIDLRDSNANTGIKGITVLVSNGGERTMGRREFFNQRPLVVRKDMCLVGLAGCLGPDGRISRLGILECPGSGDIYFNTFKANPYPPELPVAHRFSWSTKNSKEGMWATASFNVMSISDAQGVDSSYDIAPQTDLIWADYSHVLLKVKRISAYVVQDVVFDRDSNGNPVNKNVNVILGFRVEYLKRVWQPERHVGIDREQDEDGNMLDWPEEHMKHFDINGRDGEFITEIGQTPLNEPTAVVFRTNRGREVIFGDAGTGDWAMRKTPEGQTIVGIAAMFATQCCLNKETGAYGHLKLTSLLVVTQRFAYGSRRHEASP